MKNMRGLALGLAAVLLLSGCGAGADSSGSSFAPAEEDRLVVYTSHKEEVWWPIVREFEERTGIWVDVVTGGTNELLSRIAQEAEAPAADVMFGGGVDSLEVYGDCFEPYVCVQQEAIAERYRSEDGLWTPFSALPVVLIYNTKLLSPGEVADWADLLQPEFQGKIAFTDPGVSGSCFTGLVTLLQAVGGDRDETLRQFARQLEGRELDSSGDILAAVSSGSCWVGVTLEESAWKRVPSWSRPGGLPPGRDQLGTRRQRPHPGRRPPRQRQAVFGFYRQPGGAAAALRPVPPPGAGGCGDQSRPARPLRGGSGGLRPGLGQ